MIKLDRIGNVYQQGEYISGKFILDNKYELKHDGVFVSLEGFVEINANLKSNTSLLNAFGGSTRTIPLVDFTQELLERARPFYRQYMQCHFISIIQISSSCPVGESCAKASRLTRFEIIRFIGRFKMLIDGCVDTPTLYETYHGLFISIQVRFAIQHSRTGANCSS